MKLSLSTIDRRTPPNSTWPSNRGVTGFACTRRRTPALGPRGIGPCRWHAGATSPSWMPTTSGYRTSSKDRCGHDRLVRLDRQLHLELGKQALETGNMDAALAHFGR